MTCKNCSKEYDAFTEYCACCGMAVKPPTEAENRIRPHDSKGALYGIILLLPVFAFLLALIIGEKGLEAAVGYIPYILLMFLCGAFLFATPIIYNRLRAKKLPLVKRIADIAGKEGKYGITFQFPNTTRLWMRVSLEAYRELEPGDRVILKYKMYDIIMPRAGFCGYELYNEGDNP